MIAIRKTALSFTAYFFGVLFLTACMAAGVTEASSTAQEACPVTEGVWAVHPEDAAIQGTPAPGYYIINQDSTLWVGANWMGEQGTPLQAGEEGNKVGWFRPAGADLEVTGQRLDGEAPPIEFEASCCYPTRFQASGLYFPTEGCWKVNAKAAESELTFVVWVQP